MNLQNDTTGIVLAGGMSSRLGVNKALIPWRGKKLIEVILDLLIPLFPATLVLVKRPEEFRFLDRPGIRIREDLIRESHPLGGILSGLTYTETDYAFVCACDMPYIRSELIEALFQARDRFDVTVPVWDGKPQPLCGIYSKRCMEPIESMIEKENYTVFELYDDVRTRYIDEDVVRGIDPRGLSFVDVDTVDDYLAAQRIGRLEDEADA
jgi:molybdopterin-guanine dinucleotide biosynthesis protein A